MIKNKNTKRDDFRIRSNVYEQVLKDIGSAEPELGGFLLGNRDGTVTDFIFDSTAKTTGGTYTPDIKVMSKKINEKYDEGRILIGCVHSHPYSYNRPSMADIAYSLRIMEAFRLDKFHLPILTFSRSGVPVIDYYVVHEDGHCAKAIPHIVEKEGKPKIAMVRNGRRDDSFARIEKAIDLDYMKDKTVVAAGVGGASDLHEALARCGVERFKLFDFDVYDSVNISNQFGTRSAIGRSKTEELRGRILDINPNAVVDVIPNGKIDDSITDEEFELLVGEKLKINPEDVLICAFTDDMYAQCRCAAWAVKYGTPYISAQLYENGDAAEVFFSYPGVTSSCPRCALESRYQAYKNGFKNKVTSSSSTIFSTIRVNAICGQICLMLLQYGAKSGRYATILDKVRERNFLQVKLTPFPINIGNDYFKTKFDKEYVFFDQTVWIPQVPNSPDYGYAPCPLCGGEGLLKARDTIKDTREGLI